MSYLLAIQDWKTLRSSAGEVLIQKGQIYEGKFTGAGAIHLYKYPAFTFTGLGREGCLFIVVSSKDLTALERIIYAL